MAERVVDRLKVPGHGDRVRVYKWAGLQNGDTGAPIELHGGADKNLQITGTAGAGLSVVAEGDNSGDNLNFYSLAKGDGSALSLTATPSGAQILDHPLRFRPRVAAGDGNTVITAWLFVVDKE